MISQVDEVGEVSSSAAQIMKWLKLFQLEHSITSIRRTLDGDLIAKCFGASSMKLE